MRPGLRIKLDTIGSGLAAYERDAGLNYVQPRDWRGKVIVGRPPAPKVSIAGIAERVLANCLARGPIHPPTDAVRRRVR